MCRTRISTHHVCFYLFLLFWLPLRAALPPSRVDDQQAAILQQLLSFDFAARPGAPQLLAEPFCKPLF